jgi:hypothetical protein
MIGSASHLAGTTRRRRLHRCAGHRPQIAKVIVSNDLFSGNYIYISNLNIVSPVPEPGTWWAAGAGSVLMFRRIEALTD